VLGNYFRHKFKRYHGLSKKWNRFVSEWRFMIEVKKCVLLIQNNVMRFFKQIRSECKRYMYLSLVRFA
jgi:hypothetical protein